MAGQIVVDYPCAGTVPAPLPVAVPQADNVGREVPTYPYHSDVIVTDPQGPQVMVDHEGTPIEAADPPEGAPNTTWWLDSPATQIVLSSVEGPQRYA